MFTKNQFIMFSGIIEWKCCKNKMLSKEKKRKQPRIKNQEIWLEKENLKKENN